MTARSVRMCCYTCLASQKRGAEPSEVCPAVLVCESWQYSCLQERLDALQPVLYARGPIVKHKEWTLGSLMHTNISFYPGHTRKLLA